MASSTLPTFKKNTDFDEDKAKNGVSLVSKLDTCCHCRNTVKEWQCFRLNVCHHLLCRICLRKAIRNTKFELIACPMKSKAGCSGHLLKAEIKGLVPEDDYNRYLNTFIPKNFQDMPLQTESFLVCNPRSGSSLLNREAGKNLSTHPWCDSCKIAGEQATGRNMKRGCDNLTNPEGKAVKKRHVSFNLEMRANHGQEQLIGEHEIVEDLRHLNLKE